MRPKGLIECVSAMRNGARRQSEYITVTKAEQMVASGRARWVPGLRKVMECSVSATGIPKEWRKGRSAGYAVMQMLPLGSSRPKHKPIVAWQ